MAKSAPLGLLPITIVTLAVCLYRMIISDMPYEKIISLIVTMIHLKRFYDHSGTIMKVSIKEWEWSLIITLGIFFVLYNILIWKKSIFVFAIIAGFLQIMSYVIVSRHIEFNWVSPYDIPILLSSLFIGYSLFKRGDKWSIVWFSDVIYHIWELM